MQLLNTDLMGLRIKQKRTEKNITQDDLAKNLGLNKSTIQRYETGKIKAVKLPVIEAMARMLHVNPAWFIGKSEEETPAYSCLLYTSVSPGACFLFDRGDMHFFS